MRQSSNYIFNGVIWHGYSYDKQCWIEDNVIQDCGHPKTMSCDCYGRQHAGEQANLSE